MKYLTITQISEKWNISSRRVRALCSQDKIEGATYKNGAWLIPENSQKPIDGRTKKGRKITPSIDPIILLFNAEYCLNTNENKVKNEDKILCRAHQFYLEGRLEEAETILDHFAANCEDNEYLIVCNYLLLNVYIIKGEAKKLKSAYIKLRKFILKDKNKLSHKILIESQNKTKRAKDSYDTITNAPKELIPLQLFFHLRKELTYCIKNKIDCDLSEYELICRMLDYSSYSEIALYYHILLSICYKIHANDNYSNLHLNKALKIAIPRKWYIPFAEYSYLFDFSSYDYLDQETLKIINALSYKTIDSYFKLNYFPKQLPKKCMTTLHIQVIFQIAFGKSNKEIAKNLNISYYKVKQLISEIYVLTEINSREELKDLVLSSIIL